jgi:hypothetical protein
MARSRSTSSNQSLWACSSRAAEVLLEEPVPGAVGEARRVARQPPPRAQRAQRPDGRARSADRSRREPPRSRRPARAPGRGRAQPRRRGRSPPHARSQSPAPATRPARLGGWPRSPTPRPRPAPRRPRQPVPARPARHAQAACAPASSARARTPAPRPPTPARDTNTAGPGHPNCSRNHLARDSPSGNCTCRSGLTANGRCCFRLLA